MRMEECGTLSTAAYDAAVFVLFLEDMTAARFTQ